MSRARDLYRLQAIDLELAQGAERLQQVEALLGESEALRQARQAHEQARQELNRWQIRLRDLELEMASLNEKVTATEERLYSGRITNPKELSNLQEEVQHLKRRRSRLEDDVIEAMVMVEESREVLSERSRHLQDVEARWREEQAALLAEQTELEDRLKELQARQKAIRAAISPADLSLYDGLRRRKGGRAVASLEGNLCRGCGVTVPTSQARAARQNDELIFCPTCGRILCPQ